MTDGRMHLHYHSPKGCRSSSGLFAVILTLNDDILSVAPIYSLYITVTSLHFQQVSCSFLRETSSTNLTTTPNVSSPPGLLMTCWSASGRTTRHTDTVGKCGDDDDGGGV